MHIQKITDILTPDDIRALTQASDWQGWLSVLTTWIIIAASMALAAWHPSWWTVMIALVLLGGRQLALAILMHETSHYSLFRTKKLNDLVGTWLCAAPVWQDVPRYRKHHLAHHAHTGTEKDTDLGLVEPFPTTWMGLVRKFLRDLSGLSGIKRVIGLLLIDLGFVTYTASTGAKWIDQRGRKAMDVVRTGLRNMGPMLLTNAALLGFCIMAGHAWLYGLWLAAYMTTFSLFLRVRAMAEHACTVDSPNQFLNTRTTRAGLAARLTVAPHHVNYHLEHHVLMTVPHYRLRALHQRLKERGVFEDSPYAAGYWDVLRTVGQGKLATA